MIDDVITRSDPPDVFEAARADDLPGFLHAVQKLPKGRMRMENGTTIGHVCAHYGSEKVLKAALEMRFFHPWSADAAGLYAFDYAVAKGWCRISKLLYDVMYPTGWALEGFEPDDDATG